MSTPSKSKSSDLGGADLERAIVTQQQQQQAQHLKRPVPPSSRIPPSNFNLIERASWPTQDFKPIEGLVEKISALQAQGRLRSALDELFKVLDTYPDHPEALMLAALAVGEGDYLQAQEPLPEEYISDRRLDPIFAVCSKCHGTWVPKSYLTVTQPYVIGWSVNDPIGVQCYNCGYVVCRNCQERSRLSSGGATISKTCPNCHQKELTTPVFPTGRPLQQMKRHAAPIIRVIVFREGQIRPDPEYVEKLLETFSPDALETDGVIMSAFPVPSWPEHFDDLADALLAKWEGDGKLPVGSLFSAEKLQIQDAENGTRVGIVKVLQPSPEEKATSEGATSKAFSSASKRQVVKKEKRGFLKKLFTG